MDACKTPVYAHCLARLRGLRACYSSYLLYFTNTYGGPTPCSPRAVGFGVKNEMSVGLREKIAYH